MPKNGPEWHSIRQGLLPKLNQLTNYSESLKTVVQLMMCLDPQQRPSAEEILTNYLQREAEFVSGLDTNAQELIKKQLNEPEMK